MNKKTLSAFLFFAAMLFAVGPWRGAIADSGSTAKAAQSVFQENPKQSDPVLEQQRLRNEGVAKYESGLALDEALREFQQAFELSGQAGDAFNVAITLFKKNDIAGTKKWLDQALQKNPNFPNAYYLLGVIARADGDAAAARKNWERARQLAPDDGYVHYQLAMLALSERNDQAFLQSLVNALALEPDNTAALYQMYRYYQTSGNRELAEQTLAKFNTLKKQEKFSRKEKQKDPGKLAQPLLTVLDSGKGFEPIAVAPVFAVSETKPGCKAVAADSFVTLTNDSAGEAVAIACGDGRLLRADPAKAAFTAMGKVPANTRDIRLEWFDEKGPRVLASTKAGLDLGKRVAGESSAYSNLLKGASGPLALLDMDADGDIDIVSGGGKAPLTNAGKLQFIQEEAVYKNGPVPSRLTGAKALAIADMQRDGIGDVLILRDDALLVAAGSPAGFREALRLPAAAGSTGLIVADFSNDGRPDVVLIMPEAVRMLWNPDLRPEAKEPAVQDLKPGFGGLRRIRATDYNNDGLLDILVLSADGQATMLRNQGGRDFSIQPLGKWPKPAAESRIVSGDYDLDGREDLAYLSQDGGFVAARNTTEGGGKSLALFANGVRASPSGLLTQIETRRGSAYAYVQSQGGVQHIGVGNADYVEILRLEWTTGFVENKLKLDASLKPYVFKESERISGSCPSLFVWDGEKFEYLTDTFISGPMGVPLDRGVYFQVRDREMLVIPGDRVKLRDGRLDIRFTEELHESVFVDRLRLYAVDHPVGTEIYPHSRLAPVPAPEEPFYTVGGLTSPARAVGSDGSDLTAAVAKVDKLHADYFPRSRHAGFAEPHWMELDIPDNIDPADVDALLATGWFFYFESYSMIAEAQLNGGPKLPWPWLQEFVDGVWRDVGPVGIPTGKGKTAVMPLHGQLKSRHLRITSGISIYWDRIAFAMKSGVSAAKTLDAPLTEAALRFHGFSALTARNPELFDYHAVSYSALWSPMQGLFTAYGPVDPLLQDADGKYALFGSGDEIAMSFQVPEPPDSPLTTRSYLLEIVGYVKDGDRYTAFPGQVEPLPYLGLTDYPPPVDERLTAAQSMSPQRTRPPLDFKLSTLSVKEEQ